MIKVLFIEDEAKFQKTFVDFFKSGEWEVVSAYDGESGLRMAEEHTPDLILLDLILPKEDGFGVLRKLKRNPRLRSVPVLILTNLEGSQYMRRAMSLGALDYIIKANYSLPEIMEKIKGTLRKRTTSNEN